MQFLNDTSKTSNLAAVAIKRCAGSLAAMVLVCGLFVVPTVHAQNHDLPSIGDAAGTDLSPATERRIGETIMRGLRRDRSMISDPEFTEYLNKFAAKLTSTSPARGFSFEFFLLRDSSLNAFALPGGFIGVHSGLVLTSTTESELASVLAHEIGHVTQRHVARMLAESRRHSVLSLAAIFMAMLAASSSPDAAAGLIALGGSVYDQQMLSFSRDAEREADRIGLEILHEAGFNHNDMVSFFGRMQRATRIYENGAPSYLRTHPLTTERMADIQNRVIDFRYRQRADSLSFHLVKARLRIEAGNDKNSLRDAVDQLTSRIEERTFLNEAATWYGLANARAAQKNWPAARDALANAKRVSRSSGYGESHPFFDRLAAQVEFDAGNLKQARKLVDAGLQRYPRALALRLLKARIALSSRQYGEAVAQIEAEMLAYRSEPALWQLLGEAYAGSGKDGLSHWAVGERYVLMGAWRSALEQFSLAGKDESIDFYKASQIDARIVEVKQRILEETEARNRRE